MKKKVIKEAGRIAEKKIGTKIEGCFFGMLFMYESDGDAAITYFNGYMNGLAAAGAISMDMAKELQRAIAYATYNEWVPDPEIKTSYTVVWKFNTAEREDVIDGYREKYSAWNTVKEFERKFGDDIEYMYMLEVNE